MIPAFSGLKLLVCFYLSLPLVLFLACLVLRKKSVQAAASDPASPFDVAIIIAVYRQCELLPRLLASLSRLEYRNYHVYVVADNCPETEIKECQARSTTNVTFLFPGETLASNTRSVFFAIEHFIRPHDILSILDVDNVVRSDYLDRLLEPFRSNFKAVQGKRMPGNLDSDYARLDAVRDLYYTFYDAHIMFALGSSATLAGSGMAFSVELFKECFMDKPVPGPGFDKVLQYEIVKRGFRIAYAPDAEVCDEKTVEAGQLIDQRSRWFLAWLRYSRYGLKLVMKGLIRRDFNQVLFGTIILRPPLFVLIGVAFAMMAADQLLGLNSSLLIVSFSAFIASFFPPFLSEKASCSLLKAVKTVPLFVACQCLALIRVLTSRKLPVATSRPVQNRKITQ